MPVIEFDSSFNSLNRNYRRGVMEQTPKGVRLCEVTQATIVTATIGNFSHTVINRENRFVLIVIMATRSGGAAIVDPSVWFNSRIPIKIASVSQGTTSSDYVGMYYLQDPPIGSNFCIIQFAANVRANIAVVNFSGVARIIPIGVSLADAAASAASHTQNLSPTRDYQGVISGVCTFTTGTKTGGLPFITSFGSDKGEVGFGASTPSVNTITWNFSPNSISTMVSAALEAA